MTQADLSRALDTTPGNVNRWAKGDGVPGYDLCEKLLKLGMTVEELFGVEYNPKKPDATERKPIDFKNPEFLAMVKDALAEMKRDGQI